MIASSKRNIKSGSNYNQYFDLGGVQGNEVTLMHNGGVEDTIEHMKKIAGRYKSQTAKIAQKLKGKTVAETSRNIWNFVYQHIQYKRDNPLREQIRTPLRTWRDRASGVDCDCYSVFISSILQNLGIGHKYRIAAYQADYQHVYVVVPDGSNEIIIDCVADQFNYEVSSTKKKDFTVMNGSSLNGLNGACRSTQPAVVYMSRERLEKRGYVFTTDVLSKYGIAFSEVINENGNVPEVHATINGQSVVLPTAITRQRAKALVEPQNLVAQPQPPTVNGLGGITNTKKVLTGLGIGALLYFFFKGDDNKTDQAGRSVKPQNLAAVPVKRKVAVVKL